METQVLDRNSVLAEIKENKESVRDMVMESYRHMQEGKGRDYKDYFSEMERTLLDSPSFC